MIKLSRDYLESAIARICFGNYYHKREKLDEIIDETIGALNWKRGLWKLLKSLPHSSNLLGSWLAASKSIITGFLHDLDWPIKDQQNLDFHIKQKIMRKSTNEILNKPVNVLFAQSTNQNEITIETVHAAKGKNYNAVMFIVNDNNGKKGKIKQIHEADLKDEEIRTVYVAMTRPRKILIIAIPEDSDEKYLSKFPDWMIQQKKSKLIE
jgi:DNA helicase II / ATP-dependent DNA helicase PcrA